MINQEIATFAGGCFWCMVEPFDERPGILSVVSGYTGATVENPTYEQVCTNTTGHLEAVKITFDPNIMSYEQLVNTFGSKLIQQTPAANLMTGENPIKRLFFIIMKSRKKLRKNRNRN